MARPSTLSREISPPPSRKRSAGYGGDDFIVPASVQCKTDDPDSEMAPSGPSLAAIEAGKTEIRNHLAHFSRRLSAVSRPSTSPRLSFDEYENLYRRSEHTHGCHFVVHQHDHPISGMHGGSRKGVHYDLRLQFSQTSSVSFAIPYGLPGNPNSSRPSRMAIETRVHNLWNNLIETASHATGSLLIWDTGEYEVLPWDDIRQPMTDDELSGEVASSEFDRLPHNERLCRAFQSHHIRLRLHGSRLPTDYTVSLRLPRANDRSEQPRKPKRKRRRIDPARLLRTTSSVTSTDSDSGLDSAGVLEDSQITDFAMSVADASEDDEDATIRANNAYTGATNSIGSVHQRHWFLTLDKRRSGFQKIRTGPDEGQWMGDWPAFYVRGRENERSILTGRTADQVMADEGVEKFVGRKMWRPIME